MKKIFFIGAFLLLAQLSGAQEAYIGEIRMFAGRRPPTGWMLCQGQTLKIQQNLALFSILGVSYGGDGKTTFMLPDMISKVPVGPYNPVAGKAPGESADVLTAAPASSTAAKTTVRQVGICYMICIQGIYPPRS